MRTENAQALTGCRNLIIASLLWAFTGVANAAPLLYVNSDQRQFGIVDLATGGYTHRGNTPDILLGLGINEGTLYAIDTLDRLVSVNPNNATTTVIGPTGITGSGPIPGFGSVAYFTSLTTGSLFAFDWSNNLYSIDPGAGASALIGPTGIPQLSGPFGSIAAAGDVSSLYFLIEEVSATDFSTLIPSSLYRINPQTGASVLITDAIPTLPFGGAGFANGSMFAFRNSIGGILPPQQIWQLNPSSGTVLSVSDLDPALGDVFGATQAPIPEPGSMLLVSAALAALAWRRGRR
jgi:hypothetical protein